jgi:3-(3-hydroxy-phenyl)propionate hydroxylase
MHTEFHPVVIIGAGPVGLSMALELEGYGHRPLVIERRTAESDGSRAICYSQRSLDVWNRLGAVHPVIARGVQWKVGKVFHGDGLAYQFDLQPDAGYEMPAFVNLQQNILEQYLIESLRSRDVPVRWGQQVTRVIAADEGATITIESDTDRYEIACDWLIAADGVRSRARRDLGLGFAGQVFEDRFLIADVRMRADFPTERWFWFDPPFHEGQSTLLHRQADNVFRIDFQLGWDADPEEERKPERVIPRIRAMLGDEHDFELVWTSVYTFQCRRMESFVHGHVLFAGDSAHQVSPFGARGANSGVQDAENLAWKLDLVMRGISPASLLRSYDAERTAAADDNILNSTRSTEFIAPKGGASLALRQAVLTLASEHSFIRPMVNSGRLDHAAAYVESPLSTPDADRFDTRIGPGYAAPDAPVLADGEPDYVLRHLGWDFRGIYAAAEDGSVPDADAAAIRRLATLDVPVTTLVISPGGAAAPPEGALTDVYGKVAARYDLAPGTFYLVRPDQYIAARWRHLDAVAVEAAVARATRIRPPRSVT